MNSILGHMLIFFPLAERHRFRPIPDLIGQEDATGFGAQGLRQGEEGFCLIGVARIWGV
jgi:hypothetical protein